MEDNTELNVVQPKLVTYEFQVYDFCQSDKNVTPVDASDEDVPDKFEYRIHIFGRTLDDKSVYVELEDYKPYFFVRVPDTWTKNLKLSSKNDGYYKKKEFTTPHTFYTFLRSRDNKLVFWKNRSSLIDYQICRKKIAYGFTADKEFTFIKLTFDNLQSMKKFVYAFQNNKLTVPVISPNPKKYSVYNGNLVPMLDCFHKRNIRGCSWIRIETYEQVIDEDLKQSHCNLEFNVSWTDLISIEKVEFAPFRICFFDIETRIAKDGGFPNCETEEDEIIQIGCTYNKYGEKKCYRKYIVTSGTCDPLENTVVEGTKNEKKLLQAWKNEMINSDCDVFGGWNSFWFDEKYIFERSKLYGIDNEINCFGKFKDTINIKPFVEMNLDTAAKGDNSLRYYDVPGRVNMDLMHVIRDNEKLDNYKLDFISSYYVRGKLSEVEKISKSRKCNKWLLKTTNMGDIEVLDFIHIELIEQVITNRVGEKHLIVEKTSDGIIIETEFNLNKEIDFEKADVFWSQAKDDIDIKQLNVMQDKDSESRAVIAKYCVKDCVLCNLICAKREIITNYMQMASVCYVPLKYLFVRGQGVKCFSLWMKFIGDKGYIFPMLRKQEKEKYEGAIVFDPVPGYYDQAIAVPDYASLYPRSIMHKNMSLETIVLDESFDNHPNYDFFNSSYVNSEGVKKYVRFAKKKDNSYGLLPECLNNLLEARTNMKKQMKKEQDPTKKKIWDGAQLAFKITANSIYGQLGSNVSPIYQKDIAACTTATGREMLIFAKIYIEQIFPPIVNGLRFLRYNGDQEKFNNLLSKELKDFDDPGTQKIKDAINKSLDGIKEFTIRPTIRYGDTDSVFSDFRFYKSNNECEMKKSKYILKNILEFGGKLVFKLLNNNPVEEKKLWMEKYKEYYVDIKSKILKCNDYEGFLQIPITKDFYPEPEHWYDKLNNFDLNEKMHNFVKRFVEEACFPWVWSIQEALNLKRPNLEKIIFDWGIYLITNANFKSWFASSSKSDLNDNLIVKEDILDYIKTFVTKTLKEVVFQSYKIIDNDGSYRYLVKVFSKGDKQTDDYHREQTINTGIMVGDLVKSRLPFPHDLEYEKTYHPFLQPAKKKYEGKKYEFDPYDYKLDSMGSVLKRRDNAPIVKVVVGGIVNHMLDRNPDKAIKWANKCLKKMFEDKYDIKYFLFSKSIKKKEKYKDWTRISHAFLAFSKIAKRDPTNMPQPGDRIFFGITFDKKFTKDTLQGERLETPDYIKENDIPLDMVYYLTNQLRTPMSDYLKCIMTEKELDDFFDGYITPALLKREDRTAMSSFGKKKSDGTRVFKC